MYVVEDDETVLGWYESPLEASRRAYEEVYRLLSTTDTSLSLLNDLKRETNTAILTALMAGEEPPPYQRGYFGEIGHIYARIMDREHRVWIIKEET